MQPIGASIIASGVMTLGVEGVICLKVEVGRQKASIDFGVEPKLETEMVIVTAFIDRKILKIE